MLPQQEQHFSPLTNTKIYDVFLSFRGKDTRTGFTGNLYSALCQRGVMTFMDDDGLRKGEEITPSLLNAIQNSRMAIIIFSKNYASSTFCLKELVHILECYTKQKMWIWPVFYDVDPTDVRYQTGSYGAALSKHEQGRFKDDLETVRNWRLALRQAANLSGCDFKHGREYEHKFIREITEEVFRKLNRPLLRVADYPVGLDARMQHVLSLMGAESDNKVNMIGIHGMGGIGKSTIARAIYNAIAYKFEGSCFLANVREKSTRQGIVQIQEIMLSELLGQSNIRFGDMNQGIPIIKERLRRKKVLLVLDDIDKKEQLQATAGGPDWFCLGSIVIITTRDKHLLDLHDVKNLYEVQKFNDTEALELFRWNALKNKEVDPSYMEIMKCAVSYASGLPLALETIGSNLFGKTFDEWRSALEAYERIPNRDVQEILRVSYDGLEENEKEIFLDIACFFNGCPMRYVTNMLRARGFHPEYGIRVLETKSLINIWEPILQIDAETIVRMHDLIQSMGREIVRQQSTSPQKRNRLWSNDEVICILENNMKNDEIEALMLDMPEDKEVQWNDEVLRKMENLKMLIKRKGCYLRRPKYLSNNLRMLEWWGYHATSLPTNFHSKNLVILNLSFSCFQWDKPLEKSDVLSHLIFISCQSIEQIPDVSGFPNLTELCVDNCTNLIEIHNSVGFLDKLQRFSAKGCTKLRIGPRAIKLTSLEYLSFRDCNSFAVFPEILEPMKKLEFVDLEGTIIENLPPSIKNLQGIRSLSLNRCTMLEANALSNIIHMLPNFLDLKELLLLNSNLTILPECIEECRSLKRLYLYDSKKLQEIRGLPPCVTNFSAGNTSLNADSPFMNKFLNRTIGSSTVDYYVLPGQRIPEWFDHYSRGDSLCFWFRKEFPCFIVGVVSGAWDNMVPPFCVTVNFFVKTNNMRRPFSVYNKRCIFWFCMYTTDHLFFFKVPANFDRSVITWNIESEDEWIYGEIFFEIEFRNSRSLGTIKWTGVHMDRTLTKMENVRFKNPCRLTTLWEAPDIQQQQLDHGGAVLDQSTMILGESSAAPSFAAAQSSTSSSSEVRRELHRRTNSIMLPAIIDASLTSQTELTEDEDAEMEAFYASLDSETHFVLCSHDKTTTSTLSKEVKEAWKVVQEFFDSNDTTVLLHPGRCSVMKTCLEYLSNLSADDGVPREMKTLILEVSREFQRWSRDYNEANMKIESTTSMLERLNELEAGLENNKKKFREVVASDNEAQQKLAKMKKIKEDLEEQLNAINVNIFAFESETKTMRLRKADIFEEAKMLKTQRDKLRERTPHLQHEHGLGKETQQRIEVAWSELKEKFKNLHQCIL